jgi:hypothetical protein
MGEVHIHLRRRSGGIDCGGGESEAEAKTHGSERGGCEFNRFFPIEQLYWSVAIR